MIKNILKIITIYGVIIALSSCNGSSETEPDFPLDEPTPEVVVADQASLNEVIEGFSSPVEMAALINDLDISFAKKYLAPTSNAHNYDTNFKKAIALGILSADLGYLNVYNKTAQVVEYLAVIKKVSDDLKIGHFFDFHTLKRLATNNDNLDSLMFLSVHSFHQMDQHLRSHNRSNLSALVVTGVWIEGLYLATQILKEHNIDEVKERVAEQKIILESLAFVIKAYSTKDSNFSDLYKDIQSLEKAYSGVTFEIIETEPRTEIIDGIVVIIPDERSEVNITKEQIQEIIQKTEKIRNKLIAL